MKRTFKRTVLGAAAALMLVAPIAAMPSFANAAPVQQSVQYDRGDRNDRGDWNRDNDRGDRYRDNDRGDRYRDNDRNRDDRGWRNDRGWNDSRYDRRDDHRQWRRGDRLPAYYRSHYREVSYRDHGYRAPPRGYHYVRDDRGETLLVGIATGAILGVILSGY